MALSKFEVVRIVCKDNQKQQWWKERKFSAFKYISKTITFNPGKI